MPTSVGRSVEVVPALLDALSTENWILRQSIPSALGKLGPAGRAALPVLARLARIELADDFGQCPAIEAIRSIAPSSLEAQSFIVPLVTLLRDSPSESQRQKAIADDARPLNVLSHIDRPEKTVKMGNVAFS